MQSRARDEAHSKATFRSIHFAKQKNKIKFAKMKSNN